MNNNLISTDDLFQKKLLKQKNVFLKKIAIGIISLATILTVFSMIKVYNSEDKNVKIVKNEDNRERVVYKDKIVDKIIKEYILNDKNIIYFKYKNKKYSKSFKELKNKFSNEKSKGKLKDKIVLNKIDSISLNKISTFDEILSGEIKIR